MRTCSHHCRACDQHFTSLRAFDAHRTGPVDDRRCKEVKGGEAGKCNLEHGELRVETGVMVHS
jgi:hypothetical protein